MIRIGAFDLVEPIGGGGMATVWRASHREQGLPLALKVVTAERARARWFIRALERELRAMGDLHHPSVVDVVSFGRVDAVAEAASEGALVAGSPYLAMALADGDLGQPAHRPQSWDALRRVLLALLDALAHAHAHGVVHRDLKPGNVLLFSDGPPHRLADFGIADIERAEGAASVAGTPHYMAPEQVSRSRADQGPWTDLYALGCTAWDLATGRPLFHARDDVVRAHLDDELPPFFPAYPVPVGFEAWLATLLAKAPAARFQRAADAAWALAGLGDPPEAGGWHEGAAPMPWAELTTLRLDEVPTAEVTAPSGEAPVARAPMPDDWRRGADGTGLRLLGEGPGLFAVRRIPLVGREQERDALWAALGRVVRSGKPEAVVLAGPPGTGKSRLAEWLCHRAHEVGAATSMIVPHSERGGPASGLEAMVTRLLRCFDQDPHGVHDRARRYLARFGRSDDTLPARVVGMLRPGAGDDGDGPPSETVRTDEARHQVVRALIDAEATVRPVVLWLDDLQWGRRTVGLVPRLLQGDAPVLVVATVREMGEPTDLLPEAARLEVGPLPDAERDALTAALLELEPEVATAVTERTGGVPLFAVQLLGDWVERGVLEVGREGLRPRPGVDLEIPDALHALWQRRVERFLADRGGAEREALELAAVLAARLDPREWRAVCDEAGVEDPHDLAGALSWARLVRVDAEDGVAFEHGMLAESLHRMAREAGRDVEHHLACVRILRDRPAWDVHERMARHFLAAGELADALGTLGFAADDAPNWSMKEAERLVKQWEELAARVDLPMDDPRWWPGVSVVPIMDVFQGRMAQSVAGFARAIEHARAAGNTVQLFNLLSQMGAAEVHLAWYDEAETHFAEVLDSPDAHWMSKGRSRVFQVMSFYERGRYGEAARLGRASVAWLRDVMAECDEPWRVCQYARLQAHDVAGRWVEAELRRGDPVALAEARTALEELSGDEAIGRVREASLKAEAATNAGDLVAAEVACREALDRATELGWETGAAVCRSQLGLVLAWQGDADQARPLLEAGLAAVGEYRFVEMLALSGLVVAEAMASDHQALRERSEALRALLDRAPVTHPDCAAALECAADALAGSGHAGEADSVRQIAGDLRQRIAT